jgi:SAM-dependent methyltransferase
LSAKKTQRDAFLHGEGDGYFRRNREALARASEHRDFVVGRIAHHLGGEGTLRVLEIGCATGGNLAALGALRTIDGHGIDPSGDAVGKGKEAFPALDLRVGTADALPYEDSLFDAVWFGFCLYVVDRSLLHRVVAECDRVLRDGGLLAIHDFDPGAPTVRAYSHVEGLCSYKMDYSRLFLADPAYTLVEKASITHHDLRWTADPQERVGLWICRKSSANAYLRTS